MIFKIKVNGAIFEWRDNKLRCDNSEVMEDYKQELSFHLPTVIAEPDMIDYDDDLTDGENVYNALIGIYSNCEVLVKPDKKYLYQFDPNVVY